MISTINHSIANWTIIISDQGSLNKTNPNKLDFNSKSRHCLFKGCGNSINVRRTSGLCDTHKVHQHDLLLSLIDSKGTKLKTPTHKNIIESLINWATPRNYNLSAFFEKISFSILGNIPDVTSLANEITYNNIDIPNLNTVFNSSISVAEEFFPSNNNSSYQILSNKNIDIPIIVLIHVFIGLIICEEANRGDRWHCRMIRLDEKKTSKLGGAMPIAYFAARSFNWGIEMGESSTFLTR
ncbi:hypothetical protein [Tenacibaculum aiptasiae]|uniref:hypothetical protein n=1 Tax=Tenacibaculum aiptasiae TaxID=426481 RepID=UPI003B5B9820